MSLSTTHSKNVINKLGKIASWQIYPDGNIWWCDALYDLYGMKKGDGITPEDFQNKIYKEDLIRFNSVIELALKEKQDFKLEVRVLINNKYNWVSIKGETQDDGSIIGVTQNIDDFYRSYFDLLQDMNVVRALSANPMSKVDKIHTLLHNE